MAFNFLKRKKGDKYAVSSKSLSFSYKGQEVLKNFNVDIKNSSVTAIIGKSGSGKSTFLKLVSGVLSKSHSGKIRVLGLWKLFSKRKVGFVPQEGAFIPDLSIEDNIRVLGLNFGVREKIALKRARHYMDLLRFDVDLNKKPSELSGGQKVRLNIVLSLLHNPEIVIMDEPFVGLDFMNRKLLWHFIHSLKKKQKSVVLTSHLLSEIEDNVDKVIILKKGRVYFHGDVEKLKDKLKISSVFEIKFSSLSKSNWDEVKRYCDYNKIRVLDAYGKYVMFAVEGEKTRSKLNRLFDKLNLDYKVLRFREPTLDEVFLKAEND
ncbi:MAG: ATP-binding cassette domain-containing protein [Candidatus Pacearchaeota archaeon]